MENATHAKQAKHANLSSNFASFACFACVAFPLTSRIKEECLKTFQDRGHDTLRKVVRYSIDGGSFFIEVCSRVAGELVLAAEDIARIVEDDLILGLVANGQPGGDRDF